MFERRIALPVIHFLKRRAVETTLAAALVLPSALVAQAPAAGRGFMFGAPSGSFSLRLGLAQPVANDGIFNLADSLLTVNRGDYIGFNFTANLVQRITERAAVEMSVGYSGRSIDSHFRDFVDNNDAEIEQTTELRRVPLTIGGRYYLVSPGRQLGRLAWVPTRFVPYVSAGAGAMWYQFTQQGDFVDFQTLDVFNTELRSSNWAPSAYGAIGAEISTSALVSINAEARYDAAKAKMSNDFSGFHRIDISGVSATVGLSFRF